MAYLGSNWIIITVVLIGANQIDAYCESVEVEGSDTFQGDGIYTEQYGQNCAYLDRYIYQQGQKFLYHNKGYWMISEYYSCLEHDDSRVGARVLDPARTPEYITSDWEELYTNGWYPNEALEVECYEGDSGPSTAMIVGISIASVFGVVIVIIIVTRLVKSCKVRAATTQTIQASSTTTRRHSSLSINPHTNATPYQPPAYDPSGYTNPHFEPDSPDVQPTAPMYDEMSHEDVPPPPSYEEAVNNHKQISTISNMEPPPLYNAAYPFDATHAGQASSTYPPSENLSFYHPSSTGDA